MRYALAFISFVKFARVIAATIPNLPSCARPCYESAVETQTDCADDDKTCVCRNIEAILSLSHDCAAESCDNEEPSLGLPAVLHIFDLS
jgi:hypothetical protein